MSASKCTIVIAGISDDLFFAHACYIAENLVKLLNNFNFKIIFKSASEWKQWLQKICNRFGWSHSKSPLIWRKIGLSGNNVTYIGGARQFWEFLHNYYNIKSCLTKEELETLQLDLLNMYDAKLKLVCSNEMSIQYRRITIIGAGRALCSDLVPQLVMTKELWMLHGIVVNLYDEPGCYFKIKRIIKDIKAIGGGLYAARAIENISDGLCDCDILINLDVLTKDDQETTDDWLKRNYCSMEILARQINRYARRNMKVIFCSTSVSCFCVNVLHALVTKLPKTNIVSVAAHYGLEISHQFIKSQNLCSKNFGCPPVWGYLGINHFVDICHMVQKYDVYRPNKRALTAVENTALSIGVKRSELRWFFYMAHNKDPYINYAEYKAVTQYQVGRTEYFQICKAICDFLKLWYCDEKNCGEEILSLGISSNGSFGIPEGIVFSQPVHLESLPNGSRVWVPYSEFPLPHLPMWIYQNMITTAMIIIDKFIKFKKFQTEQEDENIDNIL